jgi:hypothetical protein
LFLLASFLVAPAAVVSLALATSLNATLADCGPLRTSTVFNDEAHYWNEVDSFARVGFRGGYFVVNERPAAAGWTRFGPHGPAFPVLYGSLARVLGWREASGPLFNVLALWAGSAVWLWLCRPDTPRLLAAILLTATFWPCLLFIPSTMQEPFHCAIAFVLAGLAYCALCGDDSRSPLSPGRAFAAFVVVAALASIFRVSWALVLVPLACVGPRGASGRTRVALAAALAALTGALWVLHQWICSPYPSDLAAVAGGMWEQPEKNLRFFLTEVKWSAQRLLWPENALEALERLAVVAVIGLGVCLLGRPVAADYRPYRFAARRTRRFVAMNLGLLGVLYVLLTEDLVSQLLGRYLFAAAVAAAVAGLLGLHRDGIGWLLRQTRSWFRFCEPDRPACLFAALSLAVLVACVVVLYSAGTWRDYRVIGPHLLLSLLVLAASSAWRCSFVVAVANLLIAVPFLSAFVDMHRGRVIPEAETVDLSGYVAYDPAAGPWTNTLLVPAARTWPLLKVPAGVGVTIVVESGYRTTATATFPLPPRSGYVLLSAAKAASWQEKGCHLQLVGETPAGHLYRNLDCPEAAPAPPGG